MTTGRPLRRQHGNHLAALLVVLGFAFGIFWLLEIRSDMEIHGRQTEAGCVLTARHLSDETSDFFNEYRRFFEALAEIPFVRTQDTGRTDALLKRLQAKFPEIVNLASARKDGRFFGSARLVDYGKNPGVSHLDFYRRLASGGDFVVMEPHKGPITGETVTGIAVPLRDREGDFNGLVGASISFSLLEKQWRNVLRGTSHSCVIAGKDGTPYFHDGPAFADGAGFSPELASIVKGGPAKASITIGGRPYIVRVEAIEGAIWKTVVLARTDIPLSRYMMDHKEMVLVALPVPFLFATAFGFFLRDRKIFNALRESEASLVMAQRVGNMGSWKWHIPSNRVEWSDEMFQIFGLEKESFSGDLTDAIARAIHPDDRAAVERANLSVLRDREPSPLEYRVVRPDGEVRTVWAEAGELSLDKAGNPEFLTGIAKDITGQKRAEAEKERMRAQLQQAMKMEAVGRLAGGVAHDFNNLLTVIIGNVSLALAKVSPSDPVAGMLSEVNVAAERAARLIQQLLAFSRKQIIEPRVLDLNALIVDLHKMLVRLIGEHIELATVPGKGLGAVKVDPGQFEQILVNLAVNARDAMPDGGRLTIETSNVDLDDAYCAGHPDATPGRFVLLAVMDTGKGMTDEVKARIYEPFFTTKPKGSGTGLGLSMAFGAVKQAGGSIAVDSEVGKGTTVRIYLPRMEREVPRSTEPALPEELPKGAETVLLVEDEDVVRNLCVQVLERQGYKVLKASCGTEAIAVAQGCGARIDLLLTDVVMPGMNGSELATQLVLLHPDMKVLFTSGYTEDAIVHHGVLDAEVSFIGKPYTPSALARKVREVLGKA